MRSSELPVFFFLEMSQCKLLMREHEFMVVYKESKLNTTFFLNSANVYVYYHHHHHALIVLFMELRNYYHKYLHGQSEQCVDPAF